MTRCRFYYARNVMKRKEFDRETDALAAANQLSWTGVLAQRLQVDYSVCRQPSRHSTVRSMNTLQSSLYAMAIMSCALYSFLAVDNSGKSRRRCVYLGAYLVAESLGFVFEWMTLHPTSPGKSLWLGSLMAISFLPAPCLWLYAREITEPCRPTIRLLPPVHLAVIAAGMALTLPLIQTTHLGPDYADPAHIASRMHSLFIHGSMLAAAALFLVQVPWYLRACVRILVSHTGNRRALFSTIEPRALDTLRILCFVVFTNWFVSLLRVLHCLILVKDNGLGVVFAFLEVMVTVGAILALIRSTTVSSLDDERVPDLASDGVPAAPAEAKYARSSLDETARMRIQRKLHEAMTAQRLHCDSALSLQGLCRHIKENPHYVSQVINQDLSSSFHDLVNRHRIEEVKSALVAAPDKTVLEICLQAGFNSKSTFNAAFRQHTGMTPSEYRNRHVQRRE